MTTLADPGSGAVKAGLIGLLRLIEEAAAVERASVFRSGHEFGCFMAQRTVYHW